MSFSSVRVLMAVICGICLSIGVVFAALGVWPVLGFMGLDVALIYWAFHSNFRDANRCEDVEISRQHILLRKKSSKGKLTEYLLPQFGTRFMVDRHSEIGITDMRLENRDRRVSFGYFLNPQDRESFASAFGSAMMRAKS